MLVLIFTFAFLLETGRFGPLNIVVLSENLLLDAERDSEKIPRTDRTYAHFGNSKSGEASRLASAAFFLREVR